MNKMKLILLVFPAFFIETQQAPYFYGSPLSMGPLVAANSGPTFVEALQKALLQVNLQIPGGPAMLSGLDAFQTSLIVNENGDRVIEAIKEIKEDLKSDITNFVSDELQDLLEALLCHLAEGHIFNGSCYIFGQNKKKYVDGRESCRQLGGDLVVYETVEEYEFTVALMDDVFYIGLTDITVENQFRWVDGTNLLSNIAAKWRSGEPNNANNEDCVAIMNTDEMLDTSCQNRLRYLCEVKLGNLQ